MKNEKRLIDANGIVKVAEHAYNEWNLAMAAADGQRQINLVYKMKELCKAVKAVADAAPTVDAVEVVHGRNIGDEECDEWYRPICQCSICRGYWMMPQNEDAHFCPVCGAKMDGGNEDV